MPPRVFISALTGQRVIKMLDTVREVYANNCLRVSTGVLNDVLIEAMAMQQPPAEKGRQLKIYYMTQVGVKPGLHLLYS